MASYQIAGAYHDDSDADDEFERGMTSPTQVNTDSDSGSEPPSNEHTPTFGTPADDGRPETIISEWTPQECAQFVASLGLRQYCEIFLEHDIVGEALIALKHDELKEMGITSVGHRLTILKYVYEVKIEEDIPIDPDDYVPPSAEQNPQHEMATKDDIERLASAVMKLRDERILQVEAQLAKLADDYRKLRIELLPVFKMAKERSEPLPYRPQDYNTQAQDFQESTMSPPIAMAEIDKPKSSLTRTFSKKLGLSSSTPKNHSPTQLPGTIHEGKQMNESGSLQPSAAANAASNSLTAGMSGGTHQSPSAPSIPSPTSPMPYHQPLAPRSYQREGSSTLPRYDGTEDTVGRMNPTPTPPLAFDGGPKSSNPLKNQQTNSMMSGSTLVPSREVSASGPLQSNNSAQGRGAHSNSGTAGLAEDDPAVQIFKSFRVALEDPCWKVLPAALRKYHIQADWRQYALYIVYGDQERCVGLEEKPLALFKDLDREGKKPMFMLRKLGNGIGDVPGSAGLPPPKTPGLGPASSGTSVRHMPDPNRVLPGGML